MIRASVQMQVGLAGVDARVRAQAHRITEAALAAAAETADANSSTIDLELEKQGPRDDPDGVSGGIRSQKKGTRGTRIADFFDQGTLGKRRRPLKRAGRSSWTVNRDGGYTAHRGDVSGKGIDPEGFFAKAKTAGRRAMRDELKNGG